MAAVTLCSDFGAQKNKVCHCFHWFPIFLPWSDGPDATILVFWMLNFKSTFSLSSFILWRGSFVPLCFLPLGWCHLHIWGCLYFSQQSCFQLESAHHFTWCTLHISWISRVTINSLDILLSQFWTSPLLNQQAVGSWCAYRFLRRQVGWSGIPVSLRIFYRWLWSTQSKALE